MMALIIVVSDSFSPHRQTTNKTTTKTTQNAVIVGSPLTKLSGFAHEILIHAIFLYIQ